MTPISRPFSETSRPFTRRLRLTRTREVGVVMNLRRPGALSERRRPPPRRPHRTRPPGPAPPAGEKPARQSPSSTRLPLSTSLTIRTGLDERGPSQPRASIEPPNLDGSRAFSRCAPSDGSHRSGGRPLMSAGSDLIAQIAGRQNLADYQKKHWFGTFAEYLDIIRHSPQGHPDRLPAPLRHDPGARHRGDPG